MTNILKPDTNVPDRVASLTYDPSAHGVGIVHFGCGAFHRAHQAIYTDDVLAKFGGDWRILGVSLQSTGTADALNAQDGLYTLVTRGGGSAEMDKLRLIGSIASVAAASRDKAPIFKALANPATHIVSMTVTEKAYGIDRQTGQVNVDHPQISHDLSRPDDPIGLIGFLVHGLRARKEAGLVPFTVLCCDNLPENGDLVRAGLIDFAKRMDEDLAAWIEAHVACPNTMVDRITPAVSGELIELVSEILGAKDQVPIETETFSQWVIEDRFSGPRPCWEKVGALIVQDVAPYEHMKLRMLNGAHSMLAYLGFLNGCQYVRDVMAHPDLAILVAQHMKAAAATLEPLPDIDFGQYAKELLARFANKSIAHETYQIAMDGTQKLPQRIFAPALDALEQGQPIDCFALAMAAWVRYCSGEVNGQIYALRDPREQNIKEIISNVGPNLDELFKALNSLDQFVPAPLRDHPEWVERVLFYVHLVDAGKLGDIVSAINAAQSR